MAGSSKSSLILSSVAIALVIITGSMILMRNTKVKTRSDIPTQSMSSWQRADEALGHTPLTSTPPLDTRFIELSAFERARIPTASQTHHAMGSINGALTYNAQAFWDLNKRRGGNHTGDDINGIGGMNTDLGDPIFATCSGLVIYRGEPSPGWGKILILAHKDQHGAIYNTMYSHLDASYSAYSHVIPQGQEIGTAGTANGNYPAHLHLELRYSTGVFIGNGYRAHPGECLPAEQNEAYRQASSTSHAYKAPLAIILEDTFEAKPQLKIR